MRNISELLESALVLVPIAILIFVRVFAKVLIDKKKRQQVDSKPQPSSQTPVNKILDRLSKSIFGPPVKAPAKSEPLDFEIAEKRRNEQLKTTIKVTDSLALRKTAVSVSTPTGARRSSSNMKPSNTVSAGSTPPSGVALPKGRASATGEVSPSPFPKTVERLSPLKQAFVLSAILGKPRSFDY